MRSRRFVPAGLAALIGLALSMPARGADAPPDAWLTTKTKLAVLTDVGVESTDVNVDSVRGVVTLHGTVASEEDKKAAEAAAKGIDGVEEVRNLIQVVPAAEAEEVATSDEKIREAIESKLASDTGVENADIEVQSVNDGTVLLAGEAPDLLVHLRAVEIARDVPGVQKVASEVTTPDEASDADVWERISSGEPVEEMKQGTEKMAAETADAGEAALAGTKDAAAEVGETAKNAWEGLTGAAKDAYITSAVKSRLLVGDETPGTEINVDTEGGMVTLFGTVASEEAKAAAEKEAMEAAGVERVENEIEVSASAAKET